MRTIQDMYYDEVDLCGVELTITPQERTNSSSGSKYYIADFAYKTVAAKTVERIQHKIRNIPIWRIDTFSGDALVELSMNYDPPVVGMDEKVAVKSAA